MLSETFFLLPKVENIVMGPLRGDRTIVLKKLGYDGILDETKNKISCIKYDKWSKLRKMINEFEFPYFSSKINKPISRAFFKLLEILVDHDINLDTNTLHLAEAPGGFIEACIYKKPNDLHDHYTFSIFGCKDIPIYHKKIINDKKVTILSNFRNKGDLYDIKNINYLIKSLSSKNIRFITCDGGFAENCDFSLKEQSHHKLIYSQIITSLFILKNGGSFVVKIFDIFTELTFDYIYLLSYLFDETYMCKPHTSRSTNSEKYILCKGYNREKLSPKIEKILKLCCFNNIEIYKSLVNKDTINKNFLNSIVSLNKKLSSYQICNINNIIQINELNIKITKSRENLASWYDKYYI
jgi:cap2 methyltransferase